MVLRKICLKKTKLCAPLSFNISFLPAGAVQTVQLQLAGCVLTVMLACALIKEGNSTFMFRATHIAGQRSHTEGQKFTVEQSQAARISDS